MTLTAAATASQSATHHLSATLQMTSVRLTVTLVVTMVVTLPRLLVTTLPPTVTLLLTTMAMAKTLCTSLRLSTQGPGLLRALVDARMRCVDMLLMPCAVVHVHEVLVLCIKSTMADCWYYRWDSECLATIEAIPACYDVFDALQVLSLCLHLCASCLVYSKCVCYCKTHDLSCIVASHATDAVPVQLPRKENMHA